MHSIQDFFADRSVFITGGTGFVGKVLMEKLLRCCQGIRKVYILVRPKKGQSVKQRVEDILKCKLFDTLREQQPDFMDKVIPVEGDILEPALAISDSDLTLLKSDVSVIFHSAATIRFEEPLRYAIEMNVIGTQKVVHLAKQLPHLQSFIHVSTAYANCDNSSIEERIYPSAVDPTKIIEAVGWMDDDLVNALTPHLLKEKPNTYTFTKHLAEVLLSTEGADLPLAIVRPSIIGAVWQDPLPGWIDSLSGASGLYVATGKGLLKSMHADFKAVADIIPCDMVVNTLISAAWYTAVKKPNRMQIYNCATGSVNPITWGEVRDSVTSFFMKTPLDQAFRRPQLVLTRRDYMHEYWCFVSHMIPAYIVDLAYRLVGKKPRMVRIYKSLHKCVQTLNYFVTREWEMSHKNLYELQSSLSTAEKTVFNFDPRSIDWLDYNERFCFGTKVYVLNEVEDDLPAARANLRRLRNIRYCFNTIVAVMLWRLVIARSQIARNLWFFILGLVFKFVRFFKVSSTLQKTTTSLMRRS